ncbi:glycoside hydrolase family 2 TIM barrel-domain containing protein [Arthrobacter sp. H5]|uniref:glycoside hydrolase family 2 TIM barrel-domain containing protein n=1 Tax=Arthrobacter sp. H5 TaxID=1267973 RepID=UPI0004B1637C|nr:glycoside hydrolase family 2 TIM barrel-domain containing protein [Arthrobacter sp. H5]
MTLASSQDGTYPRPQLVRAQHVPLDVKCGFAYDDDNVGLDGLWHHDASAFDREIQLPFAPESAASGIGDTGYHPVVWYRLAVDRAALTTAGYPQQGERLLLHFGAVDYRADVWVNGVHVARHDGGQTSFSADITAACTDVEMQEIVVRAEDDPLDVTMPRGKQDWEPEPHGIWYHRTTGIWRTVWIEAVPAVHIRSLAWIPDVQRGSVRCEIELSSRPAGPVALDVVLSHQGVDLARQRVSITDREAGFDVSLPSQRNGQNHERLLWSPENPTLIDAAVTLGEDSDVVHSYFGLRSTAVAEGQFLLNDRPVYVRSVLEQGYWPDSHFTAPGVAALREEVELILSLGFNAARIHQKVEDPRFLYWCDRLGLMIWGETAGAYQFSATAVARLTTEWLDIVRAYRSHPSIVTWVPLNESWGVQHGAHDPAQRAYGLALTNLTRALDPTRPVISNDGWEHTDSDMWTFHDYESSGEALLARYADRAGINAMIRGLGPVGRRMSVLPVPPVDLEEKPVMLTEFGGVSYAPGTEFEDSWGYSTASNADDFESRVGEIVGAVRAASSLVGFCYTQLTDTRQETNGLCTEDRKPKLPAEVIAGIIRG